MEGLFAECQVTRRVLFSHEFRLLCVSIADCDVVVPDGELANLSFLFVAHGELSNFRPRPVRADYDGAAKTCPVVK